MLLTWPLGTTGRDGSYCILLLYYIDNYNVFSHEKVDGWVGLPGPKVLVGQVIY